MRLLRCAWRTLRNRAPRRVRRPHRGISIATSRPTAGNRIDGFTHPAGRGLQLMRLSRCAWRTLRNRAPRRVRRAHRGIPVGPSRPTTGNRIDGFTHPTGRGLQLMRLLRCAWRTLRNRAPRRVRRGHRGISIAPLRPTAGNRIDGFTHPTGRGLQLMRLLRCAWRTLRNRAPRRVRRAHRGMSEQLQRFLVQRRELFAQHQHLVAPVTLAAEPGKAHGERRVVPAPRQPGAVVHQP